MKCFSTERVGMLGHVARHCVANGRGRQVLEGVAVERVAPRGFGIVSVLWALPKAAGLDFDEENITGSAGAPVDQAL